MAADIDLLIALSGSEQVKSQLGGVQLNLAQLRTQGLQAMQGMRGLEGAFDALSGKGKLSAESITQLSNLLPMLGTAGPAGLAVAGLGALTLHLFKAHEEAKRQEIAEEAERIKKLDQAARDAVVGLSAFQKAISEGKTREEAGIARSRAQGAKDAENALKREREESERLFSELSKLRAEEKALTAETGGGTSAVIDRIFALDRVRAQIDETVFALTNLTIGTDDSTRAAGENARALDRQEQSLKGNLKVIEQIGIPVLEAYLIKKREEAKLSREITALGRDVDVGITKEQADALNLLANGAPGVNAFALAVSQLGFITVHAIGDLGAAAFDQYADAMERVIDGQNAFSASSGRAARNAAASTLKALGQQAAAQATMHLAMAAAGSFGWINVAMYGTPADNLKAAALFGSVAAAAGVGGAALSVKSGGGGGGGGARPDRDSGGTDRGGPSYQVTVIGNLDDQSAADLVRRLRQAEERGDA